MRRLVLTTAIAALAMPAAAAASQGVVLSVNKSHHAVQVVDAHHVVHAYTYAGRLPRLHVGSRIGFIRSGGRIGHVTVSSSASRSAVFYARVVSAGSRGVVFKLADGNQLHFTARQVRRHHRLMAHAAVGIPGVAINIQGLEPGVTVLVTETAAADGTITITLTLPPPSDSVAGGEQQASGVISEVDTDAFVLTTDDGSDLRLHMTATALSNLNLQVCDTAAVTYHQDAGMLIADTVDDNGVSISGDCSGDSGDDEDAYGPITAISDTSVTIQTGHGPMSFQVDPQDDLTDGFVVGDDVDVTYYSNGDGTYSADDIEYNDQDVTGVVTSVSGSSITITMDQGGGPETFTVDPIDELLDGISVGDDVDVYFYSNTGQPGRQLVDWVDDLTTD